MPDDEPRWRASSGYAFGQLERAVLRARWSEDQASRDRAQAKVRMWRHVLDGMASGLLQVGSRVPVAGTPAWVTLEVGHGGFATGGYLADRPLTGDEQTRVRALPDSAPGETDRERLNLWYLSDAGQQALREALRRGTYRVELPEDAALPVVTWLLDNEHYAAALDLVHELMPFMGRLRFSPRLEAVAQPAATLVRREPVDVVRRQLRAKRVPAQIAAMRQTLRVWHPLYDRLVTLWCSTVSGDLPRLVRYSDGRTTVRGGWPCQVWPADWSEHRDAWLNDYRSACRADPGEKEHRHPKSNFARLQRALQACPDDSRALTPREVGWIRRALANTIDRHGEPGSEPRATLRASQAAVAAQPTHATLAEVMATRLDPYPADSGIPSLDPIAADVTQDDAGDAPAGHPMPDHLVRTAARALEAPVQELVARGVIPSGEVLAMVLPQLTAPLLASNLDDPTLAALYAQTYAAFRRRRSLLLLNLEHQIQFEELPWIGALAPLRQTTAATIHAVREALRQTVQLAVSAFPQAILPNPLVREMGNLARQGQLAIPLVEEVAADIFMGTFTVKWREAAQLTSRTLAGTLYARYYDLPDAEAWERQVERRRSGIGRWWGKDTADDFAERCNVRAMEAGTGRASFVAHNGAVLEQSQILTTHNLAVLVDKCNLRDWLGDVAPDLANRTLTWIVRRQIQPTHNRHAALQMIKNVAYAWRNAIFYLSFCDTRAQLAAMEDLRSRAANAGLHHFEPAVRGLAHVIGGGRFTSTGTVDGLAARRLLGWSVGNHWCLPAAVQAPRMAPHA